MTPKDKSEELVSKFVSISLSQYVDLVDGIRIRLAKESALTAVDEILTNNMYFKDANNDKYWNDVKKEIEAL